MKITLVVPEFRCGGRRADSNTAWGLQRYLIYTRVHAPHAPIIPPGCSEGIETAENWGSSTVGVENIFFGPWEWLALNYHLTGLRTGQVTVLKRGFHYSVGTQIPGKLHIRENPYSVPSCPLCMPRLSNFSSQVESCISFLFSFTCLSLLCFPLSSLPFPLVFSYHSSREKKWNVFFFIKLKEMDINR